MRRTHQDETESCKFLFSLPLCLTSLRNCCLLPSPPCPSSSPHSGTAASSPPPPRPSSSPHSGSAACSPPLHPEAAASHQCTSAQLMIVLPRKVAIVLPIKVMIVLLPREMGGHRPTLLPRPYGPWVRPGGARSWPRRAARCGAGRGATAWMGEQQVVCWLGHKATASGSSKVCGGGGERGNHTCNKRPKWVGGWVGAGSGAAGRAGSVNQGTG